VLKFPAIKSKLPRQDKNIDSIGRKKAQKGFLSGVFSSVCSVSFLPLQAVGRGVAKTKISSLWLNLKGQV
jgi:hypothetical protein